MGNLVVYNITACIIRVIVTTALIDHLDHH